MNICQPKLGFGAIDHGLVEAVVVLMVSLGLSMLIYKFYELPANKFIKK